MYDRYPLVTNKVGRIQREQVTYPIYPHGSDKPRIVHVAARNAMVLDQLEPSRIDLPRLRNECEIAFDRLDFLERLVRGQAKPVSILGPSKDAPKFGSVLGTIKWRNTLT
jgi:hypothetical protein